MKPFKIVLALSAILLLTLLCAIPVLAADNKGYVTNFQLTTNPAYDRDPSLFRAADGTYWLFFARGRDPRNIRDYESYNPDLDYYDVYFKTSKSIAGLKKAPETIIPAIPPNNAQRDISAFQSEDGTIWVFTSTGLGEGTDRYIHYYTYDGVWAGPMDVPATDYAAHISVLEDNGKIWVWYDIGYELFVKYYDEHSQNWSAAVSIHENATIAKALVANDMMYVVWTTPSGYGIYLSTSTDGTAWTTCVDPIAQWEQGTNWDPVLVKEKDVFRVCWAPDIGTGGQFLASSWSEEPRDSSSWSTPVKLTKSSYDTKNWWEFWPQFYCRGEQRYICYSSERNATGTDRIDSNIWIMQLRHEF